MPPTVHRTTRRLYEGLPEHYRISDARQDGDQPLLRYMSLLGDQAGELEDLIDRINYVSPNDGGTAGDTSDLVDPATADEAWLPFLAQLSGITLPAGVDVATRRALIAAAPAGWRAATKDAIAGAARTVLSGGKYVVVADHYGDNPLQIEVRTRTSETPSSSAVVNAILAAKAKPAGHIIINTRYGASWAEVGARFPTWADIVGHTWLDILETGTTIGGTHPASDTIGPRWKVRARTADTADIRYKILAALTAVADTADTRWRVRTQRAADILATDGPLIYLDFNDAAGATAFDSTANARNGTYTNGPTLNQAPLIPTDTAGHSILLDGVNDMVTTNYSPFSGAKTFRGVCKRTSHANRHALMGSDDSGQMLAIKAGNNDVQWWPNTGDISVTWAGAWPGDNVITEWALKHDEGAHTAELIINGVSQGVATGIAHYSASTGKLVVGSRGGPNDPFAGYYDAFDIVNGLTSNTNLAARYAAHF